MSQSNSSKILKVAALKPLENEQDTLVQNYDGTLISVRKAPLIRALAKGLGTPLNIVISADGISGFKNPDGSWNGIMGMLVKGEADLAGSPLAITKERSKTVNFTHPLYVTDITFMTNKPEPYTKSFAIFEVFSFDVWLGIVLCLIWISIFLYILLQRKETYSTVLIDTIGCLLGNSFSVQARRTNTDLILLHWFLGITILTTSYKAVMLSVITVPRLVGIRDITELSKAAKENSFMCMIYKGKRMWQVESNDDGLKSIGECLKRGERESLFTHEAFFKYPHKKSFISSRTNLNKFRTNYLISDDSFSILPVALAYSKQFCCSKKLETVLHRIVAADLLPKNLKDLDFTAELHRSKPKDYNYNDTRWKPLSLGDFTGAFLILIIGHLCSLILFIAEIVVKRYQR